MAARVGMVGAAPMCPPERPRSGVSIRKCGAAIRKCCVSICERHASMCKRDVSIRERRHLTMDAPLRGDTGGHTGTAPTTLDDYFGYVPTKPFTI
ncbi:hypothetical protein [Segatella oulorum]|uniref:hypothetical protein n=1 Tax=Segatella oulorum TaxID=28136 RepID=UPI0028EE785D|nr:hypothetical protein [Segatella oulorum]